MKSQQKFRKINPRVWTDEKFVQLSPEDKLLALYILTSAQSNRIGCFVFSPGKAAEDCGLPLDGVVHRVEKVCHTMSWGCFEGARQLYIPKWFRYNEPHNPDHFKGMLADLNDMPDGPAKSAFLNNGHYIPHHCDTVWDTVCHTVGVHHGGTPEEWRVENRDKTNMCGSAPRTGAKSNKKQNTRSEFDQWFNSTFWKTYPGRRKSLKAKCADKLWRHASKAKSLQAFFGEVMAGLDCWMRTEDWQKGGGEFVPMPQTWINQRSWEPDNLPEGVTPPETPEARLKAAVARAWADAGREGEPPASIMAAALERIDEPAHIRAALASFANLMLDESDLERIIRDGSNPDRA